MNFEIVRLTDFSGPAAAIYTIRLEGHDSTLFNSFLEENSGNYPSEVKQILRILISIGSVTGVQEGNLKRFEGKYGDGVCALYDEKRELRLYGIWYEESEGVIFLGGGGPKNVAAVQDDEKLTKENYLLRVISQQIMERINSGGLQWVNGRLIGNFKFKS